MALLSDRLRERDTADWQARLLEAGVPAAPVADVADVAGAEQTRALGMLQAVPHPAIPELRLAALPLSVDGDARSTASRRHGSGSTRPRCCASSGTRTTRSPRSPRTASCGSQRPQAL